MIEGLIHLIDVAQCGVHGADVHVADAEVLGGNVCVQATGDHHTLPYMRGEGVEGSEGGTSSTAAAQCGWDQWRTNCNPNVQFRVLMGGDAHTVVQYPVVL